jgi:hypothetical protein
VSADLIELHVCFERPKSAEHLQVVANHLADVLRTNLSAHYARQRPRVYVADIRGPEDDEA